MTYSDSDIQEIEKILSQIVGEKTWGVSLLGNGGSHINFEFGESRQDEWDSLKVRGKWSLFTNICDWRLEKDGDVLVGSNDHGSRITPALQQLEGTILSSFDLQLPALDTIFVFSNRFVLRIFPSAFMSNSTHWIFTLPKDRHALKIGPEASWSIHIYKDYRKKTEKDDC